MQHLVVMGVSGSGKTTVATILAERLGWPYAEADDFHPAENVTRMAAGIPLTDEDRLPWLKAISAWIDRHDADGTSTIVTCSALRRVYREILGASMGRVRFVHLDGEREVIGERIAGRRGHFMPASLLPSQFATLEPLEPDEDGVVVPVTGSPHDVADVALRELGRVVYL